jgi:hypothetical protein
LAYTVLIQDHVVDDRLGPDLSGDIAAANALFLEGILSYNSLFPPDSPFWVQTTALMQTSWNAMVLEKTEHGQLTSAMLNLDDQIQQAKVNVGKVAALAVAMLAQREELIPGLFKHLDHWQLACQMMDDFLDYRSDLDRGNYTHFLVLAGVTQIDDRNEAKVCQQLGSGALHTYLARILDHYQIALGECPSHPGYLEAHIEYLISAVRTFAAQYDALLSIARGIVT